MGASRRAIRAACYHPLAVRRFAPGHQTNAADTALRELCFLRSMRLICRPVSSHCGGLPTFDDLPAKTQIALRRLADAVTKVVPTCTKSQSQQRISNPEQKSLQS